MKRITLHFTAFALLAPCLVAFTAGSLIIAAVGAAYMAGLVYVCGHTAKGRKFARTYYDEITRLEKLLNE